MMNKFTKIQQRAIQYWFIDGLSELGIAATLILLAALFWLHQAFFQTPAGEAAFYLIPFAGMYGIRWIIRRIKEKDTYPRTGYVANKSGWENRRAVAAIIAFTALLFAAQIFIALQRPQTVAWMPLLGGVILAFIFGMVAYQAGLPRFYFFAAFVLLAGGGLMLSGLGDFQAVSVLSALIALLLIASGIRTRRIYVRQNPPLPE